MRSIRCIIASPESCPDNSTSGTVETWKVWLSWRVFDDLRLRGTRSRDIRAPNLSELFQAGRQSTTSYNDPFNNNLAQSGAAYVFTRSGPTWGQQAYLKASNTGPSDFFGFSLTRSQ